jgi:MFS family permease
MALVLLLSINLFNYIDRFVLAAVEPKIETQFFGSNRSPAVQTLLRWNNSPEFWMGLLATAFMASYMVTAPFFGYLADRTGRWLIVGISVILWSLATGCSGLAATAGGFTLLMITRLFVGVGEAGYGPAAPTLISDYYPVERRGAVLAWFYMAIPVGASLGYVLGGMLAGRYGWPSAFYAVVVPGLILGAWSLFMKEPPRGMADHASSRKAGKQDYLALLRNRSYMLDCAGMTAMTFAIGGISFWMPKYLTQIRNVDEGNLGSVTFKFGVISAVGGLTATLLGGMLGDALRKRFASSYFLVSGISILIACPFLLLMLYLPFKPFPWAWIMLFLAVFFLFFNTGPSNTILANVTHPSVRGTAFAMNILLIHALGDATSPPILGRIGTYSWNAVFYVVIVVMAIAGIFWLWGARYLKEDTDAAPNRLAGNAPGGFPVEVDKVRDVSNG